jgi:hypothetical protein
MQASDVEREPEQVALHFRARRTVAPAILSAFHLACDMRDVSIARQLLGTLESKMNEEAGSDASDAARVLNSLVAGHERLWTLRAGML